MNPLDPQAARATLVILLLAIGSIGAAWGYDAMVGPPAATGSVIDDDEVVTLVGFHVKSVQLTTGTLRFTGSEPVSFDPLPLTVANVTSVSITMRVSMQGPSISDTLTAVVQTPTGESIDGEVQRQANPNGYQISQSIVEDWSLAAVPDSAHYATADEETALRWAAENHTDPRNTGAWLSEVSLSPPMTPLRTGNVSLAFTFEYYVAQAFAPSTSELDGDEPPGFFHARPEEGAANSRMAGVVRVSPAFPEPS